MLHAGITGVHDHNRQLSLRAIHMLNCSCLKASEAAFQCDTTILTNTSKAKVSFQIDSSEKFNQLSPQR